MELLLLGKDAICMDLEVPHQIPEIIVNEHITKNICIYLLKPNFHCNQCFQRISM